jgi:acyl-CoA synthetase (AMP-forming)/AMP-acid ligase II
MNQTLQARLYDRLENAPDRRAFAFYNGRGEFSWQTFGQFYQQAAGRAARLADWGLGKGDVCLIILPSGELSATLLFSSLLLGAVPLLIAPPTIQDQGAYSSLSRIIKRIIRKTKPRLVVCADSMVDMRSDIENGQASTRYLFGESDVSPASWTLPRSVLPAETDVAAMQLTSGTTGFPRVCVWQQKNVMAALDGMVAAMKLNIEDICLNWTPLYHDMGLVNNFLLCLTHGVPLVMLNPLNFVHKPAIWLQALHDTGATMTWSPNFGFAITAQRVRDEQIDGVRLDGVRGFWNAAERIHLDTMLAFHKRFEPFGLRFEALKTNFGCAENVGGATFSDPHESFIFERIDRSLIQRKRIARPMPRSALEHETITVVGVGRPHPAMRVKILSRTGRPLPEGHIGEIALDTPSRMAGYLNDARATRQALFGELLRTGDLGYMRGEELFWVGRVKERINVRGKKMDPSDFEPVLLEISGLRQGCFAAFGVDEEELGTQRIVIISEVREPLSRDRQELRDEIRDRILRKLGVIVDDVVLVQPGTLTKTSSGKRRHRYFKKLYLDGGLKPFEFSKDGPVSA